MRPTRTDARGRALRSLSCAILTLAGLTACGCDEFDFLLSSSSGNTTTAPSCQSQQQVTGVRLSADSLAVRVAPTASASIALTLVSSDTTAHALSVTSASGDVTATLAASSLTPGRTVALQLTASPAAVPTQRIVVRVVASLRNAADTLTLTAEILQPFTLGVSGAFTGVPGSRLSGTATLQRAPGFTAPVSLSLDSLPASWSVAFATQTATGSIAPFDITVAGNAAPGFYLPRLKATFGATTQQQAVSVRVTQALPPPDIAITAQPGSLSLEQGQTGSLLVFIARTAPGIGLANLSVAGLPAGANGTFTPVAANDTSRLAIAVAASTPVGMHTLTITGVAGTITRQATATLTVTAPPPPPAIALTVAPGALTVQPGATGAASVTIVRTGTVATVTLDVPGLPAGVTATFAAPPAPNAPTPLTLTVSGAAAAGVYPLAVRGVAGTLTATAPLTLTIPAPTSNFTLQLAATLTVNSGATALVPVQIVRTGGFTGVSIQIGVQTVPAGGNAWVGPTVTTRDTTTLQVIGGTPGTHPVTLVASGGVLIRTAVIMVTVVASPGQDFSLVPQAKELQVPRGQFTQVPVTIQRVGGHSAPIVLTAITDNPGNYAVNFTPGTVTTEGSATVAIYASPNITPGPHLVILRGTANGVERRALLTIFVQ